MSWDRETAIIRSNPSGKRPDQSVDGRFTPQEWRALRAVALGRSIDLAWNETFKEMFKQHVPKTIKGEMRRRPGVVYAPPIGILQMPEYNLKRDRDGHPNPTASIGALVTALCYKGVLDEDTARSNREVAFKGLELKGSRDQIFKLCARFSDVPYPDPGGSTGNRYFIYDERAHIWKSYGEKSKAPAYEPGTVPTHTAVLVRISAEDGNIKALPLQELSALMRPMITLQPVGFVMTDVVESGN